MDTQIFAIPPAIKAPDFSQNHGESQQTMYESKNYPMSRTNQQSGKSH
jgi:hypothetical protein